MNEFETNGLFWYYCERCRLYSDGVCDAGACLHAPEIVDSAVDAAFKECFRAKEEIIDKQENYVEEDYYDYDFYDDDDNECERYFDMEGCKGCDDYDRCLYDYCASEAYWKNPTFYDEQQYLRELAEASRMYTTEINHDDDLPF